MSQRVLADLIGRSEDWDCKVERDVRRIDVIAELAKALRVELGELTGLPVLPEDVDDATTFPRFGTLPMVARAACGCPSTPPAGSAAS